MLEVIWPKLHTEIAFKNSQWKYLSCSQWKNSFIQPCAFACALKVHNEIFLFFRDLLHSVSDPYLFDPYPTFLAE
jgi:hypothetical protein